MIETRDETEYVYFENRTKKVNQISFDIDPIRKPIDRYPKSPHLMVMDVQIVDSIPYGVRDYEPKDFCSNNDNEKYTYADETKNCVAICHCIDEKGNTVTLRVNDAKLNLMIQVPDSWKEAECKKLRNHLVERFRLPKLKFKLEKRMQFYGWIPEPGNPKRTKRWNIMNVQFPTIASLRSANHYLKQDPKNPHPVRIEGLGNVAKLVTSWEAEIPPETKFVDLMGIVPCGWIQVQEYQIPEIYCTHSQVEIQTQRKFIKPIPVCDTEKQKGKSDIPPLTLVSYDVESYDKQHRFPNPYNIHDHIVCINSNVYHYWNGKFTVRKFSHVYSRDGKTGKHVSESGVTCFYYSNELEMIEKWRDFITTVVMPDSTIAFNQRNFDWKYICSRVLIHYAIPFYRQNSKAFNNLKSFVLKRLPSLSEKIKPNQLEQNLKRLYGAFFENNKFEQQELHYKPHENSRFWKCSKLQMETVRYTKKTLSNAFLGDNVYRYIDSPGGLGDVDMFHEMKGTKKLDSYSLDSCAMSTIKRKKLPMDKNELFLLVEKNSLDKIIEYCAVDCELPAEMAFSELTYEKLFEICRLSYTFSRKILLCGIQEKTYNSLIQKMHILGFYCNLPELAEMLKNIDGYTGAHVFIPKPAFYQKYILIVDVESLYPSKQKQNCLCPSTFVKYVNDKNHSQVKYKHVKTELGDWSFVQADGKDIVCVCAELVAENKAYRKKIKDELENMTDSNPMKKILKCRDMGVKLLLNGRYGFFGVKNGRIPHLPTADAVTYCGRETILNAQKQLKLKYGNRVEIVGGDTDSLFIALCDIPLGGPEQLKKAFDFGQEIADFLSSLDPSNNTIFKREGIAKRGLFLKKKKKYAIYLYEKCNNEKFPPQIVVKGLECKRRDTSQTLRNMISTILKMIFEEEKVEDVPQYVLSVLEKLEKNELPLSYYIITKSLKSSYSDATSPPIHLHVNKKMEQRSPGSGFKSGERIPYVMVQMPPDSKKYLQGEDPEYVKANPKTCIIDRIYYLETFLKPVCNLIEPIFKNPSEVFKKTYSSLYQQRYHIQPLDDLFEKDEEQQDEIPEKFTLELNEPNSNQNTRTSNDFQNLIWDYMEEEEEEIKEPSQISENPSPSVLGKRKREDEPFSPSKKQKLCTFNHTSTETKKKTKKRPSKVVVDKEAAIKKLEEQFFE